MAKKTGGRKVFGKGLGEMVALHCLQNNHPERGRFRPVASGAKSPSTYQEEAIMTERMAVQTLEEMRATAQELIEAIDLEFANLKTGVDPWAGSDHLFDVSGRVGELRRELATRIGRQ